MFSITSIAFFQREGRGAEITQVSPPSPFQCRKDTTRAARNDVLRLGQNRVVGCCAVQLVCAEGKTVEADGERVIDSVDFIGVVEVARALRRLH